MTPSELIIGPQTPITSSWFDTTQVTKGREHAAAFPDSPPAPSGIDSYIMQHYYDLGLTQCGLHARTNDPQDLANANRITDSWWKMSWIGEGNTRLWPDNATPPPRHAGIGSLILRAQERPEMWDWINSYTRYFFSIYIKRRWAAPAHLHDVREQAFCLQYATWLAVLLTDTFPVQNGGTETNGAQLRAQYLTDIEQAALYFGEMQRADGAWVWNDSFKDADSGTLVGVMQPFMVGLLLNALVDVHRVSNSATVKASIESQITKACRHLYLDGPYLKDQIVPMFGKKIRGFQYFYHGGTTVNPTKYLRGSIPGNWDTTDRGHIEGMRQTIGSVIAPYGYAYHLTQDPFFKTAGDEMWDSAYVGSDGIRGWANGDAKSYNMNYRNAGRYLVWSGAPIVPPPTTQPSPDGTKGTTITDSEGKVWTLGSAGETLRDGIHVSAGRGTIYKYFSGVVYTLGNDTNWYKWKNGWTLHGSEPGVTPVPPPVPVDEYVEIPLPKDTEGERTKLYQKMFAQRYAAYAELRGDKIRFRKF